MSSANSERYGALLFVQVYLISIELDIRTRHPLDIALSAHVATFHLRNIFKRISLAQNGMQLVLLTENVTGRI